MFKQILPVLAFLGFAACQTDPSVYNNDCIGCLWKIGYFCDYSASIFNTGKCDSSSFWFCGTQYTGAINNCYPAYGDAQNVDLVGYGNMNIFGDNSGTVTVNGFDLSVQGTVGSKFKFTVANKNSSALTIT